MSATSERRLLLVDDDPIALKIVTALLRDQGYAVDTASDGQQALDRLAVYHYPLVVTDWMMPVIDGLELVRRLRTVEGSAYTYVIMLTARGDDHADANHALSMGVDDLLAKPVKRDDLIARLRVAERMIGLQSELLHRNAALSNANERMRRDLAAAAKVQRALLPHAPPATPGWRAAWRSEACEELGGDTLNVFQLDEHRLAAYVLDVSGHGVGSALLAVQASRLLQPVMGLGSMLKAPRREPPFYRVVAPKDLMANLARKFPPQWDAPQFFTMVYLVIDLRSGEATLASGGHPSPLVSHPDRPVQVIDLPSSAIAMLDHADCEFADASYRMVLGDRMLLYSDGVTETLHGDQVYGQDRLVATWQVLAGKSIDEALDGLLADLADFRQGEAVVDDITLLAIEHHL